MRARPALVLLVLTLLPAASLFSQGAAPEDISTAPLHVGDRMLYAVWADDVLTTPEGEDHTGRWHRLPWLGETTLLVTIEGTSSAIDEYGLPQETVAYLIERARDGKLVSRERCHQDLARGYAMRWDYLEGGPVRASPWEFARGDPLGLTGPMTQYRNTTPITDYRTGACDGHWEIHDERLDAGQPVRAWTLPRAPSFLPPFDEAHGEAMGEPTSFRGLPALSYEFPLTAMEGSNQSVEGRLRIVMAEGYPGPVHVSIDRTVRDADETREQHGEMRLIGYAPGDKPFPRPFGSGDYPERNPRFAFAMQAPRAFDDASLALPYPYADALASLRANPPLAFSRFLREDSSAALAYASYSAGMRVVVSPGELRPGNAWDTPGWRICFANATRTVCATTVRVDETHPLDLVPGARRWTAQEGDTGSYDQGWPVALTPYPVTAPQDVRRLLAQAGIPAASIRAASYSVSAQPTGVRTDLWVSQVAADAPGSEGDGMEAYLDLERGALRAVSATTVRVARAGLLPDAADVRFGPQGTAAPASTLDGVGWPVVTAATASLAAAILLLLAKYLVLPLYTRLARAHLLKHPARALLMESVRTEPGIHLSALMASTGRAKGVTKHHLDQLVRHRLVTEFQDGEFLRYYVTGQLPPDVARRSAVLRAGSLRKVYDLHVAQPDLTLREAGAILGMSAPSVHRARKRLEEKGLLPAGAGKRLRA